MDKKMILTVLLTVLVMVCLETGFAMWSQTSANTIEIGRIETFLQKVSQ